jgi:uncharacterized peroxidase-related enzyme
MPRLAILEPENAPPKSADLLTGIISRNGGAGAMVRTMAHSPALLTAYLEFSRAMKRSKLPRAVSEKLSLAVQEWIGCELCLAAHAEAARAAGVGESEISLARQGTSVDPREAALIGFAVRVLAEPGSITDDDVAELRGHGWSDRVVSEVVGLVALNLLTGAFNLVAGLEPSDAGYATDSG